MNKEKPDYGFTAIRYFIGITICGVIGTCIMVLTSLFIEAPISIFIYTISLPITISTFYIGFSYIPLYYSILRSTPIKEIWNYILTDFKGDERVLDIGCGTGRVSINIAKCIISGKVIGIDIYNGVSGNSPDKAYKNAEIEAVKSKVEFNYGNVMNIPYPDNSFDLVTAGSVLHELHDDKDKLAALNEIYRVLKPGGKFVTIEILRDKRLYLSLLYFAFVWKTKKFWENLFSNSQFNNQISKDYTRFLNLGIFFTWK
ncbi:MAG: class I SAM-dependent methyltransferase [Promethearchaeota archaeon]